MPSNSHEQIPSLKTGAFSEKKCETGAFKNNRRVNNNTHSINLDNLFKYSVKSKLINMILAGYLTILGYIFFLIFGLGSIISKKADIEISRKTIHIMLFAVWVLIDIFLKHTIHQVIVPVIFIILNFLSYKFGIYKSVERTDNNHLGTVYFAIVVTIIMFISYFYHDLYYCSGLAVFCLTFGDGFAALIGHSFKSRTLYGEKSLYGTIACAAASALSMLLFVRYYALSEALSLNCIILLGLYSAVLELVRNGLDNFSVTLGIFALSYFLMYHYSPKLMFSLCVALIVFCIVFFAKAIGYYGSLLSIGIVFSFSFFGNREGLCFLLMCYFIVFFISVFKKKVLHIKKTEKARNFIQILINGGIGTLFIILYACSGLRHFLYLSIVAIGGCFIDSVSSDIGVLSSKSPYDLLRRRTVPAGISGGMSVLGTFAALSVTAVIALYSFFVFRIPAGDCILIYILIFCQTLVDSALGSLCQVKYRCLSNNLLTENPEYCAEKTEYYEGIKWMDNNIVNLTSSLIICFIAILFFIR